MTNLEWLKAIKKEDEEFNSGNHDRGSTEIEFRQVKALEIIAEELIRHNNYIEEYKTELKGADQIKINLDNLECPKGFTKKVMKKIKKEGR